MNEKMSQSLDSNIKSNIGTVWLLKWGNLMEYYYFYWLVDSTYIWIEAHLGAHNFATQNEKYCYPLYEYE
jgi:hypothetical protein